MLLVLICSASNSVPGAITPIPWVFSLCIPSGAGPPTFRSEKGIAPLYCKRFRCYQVRQKNKNCAAILRDNPVYAFVCCQIFFHIYEFLGRYASTYPSKFFEHFARNLNGSIFKKSKKKYSYLL